jgi:4'-phosphopantetheinyl transferase
VTHLYHIYFEQPLTPEAFLCQLSKLPASFHEKINQLKRWQDRHASLLGKLLLIKGLNDFGYSNLDLNSITYNQYGRPLLSENIDFNISHSGNYVMCALSDEGNIGVDIEEIKAIDVTQFKKFITSDELALIQNSENSLTEFYELWAKKEAVMKAEGRGLSIPLKDIKIENNIALSPYGTWHLHKIEIDPGYSAYLADKKEFDSLQLFNSK